MAKHTLKILRCEYDHFLSFRMKWFKLATDLPKVLMYICFSLHLAVRFLSLYQISVVTYVFSTIFIIAYSTKLIGTILVTFNKFSFTYSLKSFENPMYFFQQDWIVKIISGQMFYPHLTSSHNVFASIYIELR